MSISMAIGAASMVFHGILVWLCWINYMNAREDLKRFEAKHKYSDEK